MKRLSTLAIVACVPLAAVALGISPAMAEPVSSLDTATLVPASVRPQDGADQAIAAHLPQGLADVVDHATLRVLGQDVVGTYSVAMDTTGQRICIIAQTTDASAMTGASCVRKEKFAQDGVAVGLQGRDLAVGAVTTYLLPGGVDAAPLKARSTSSGGTLTGQGTSQLVVQAGADTLPSHMDLQRNNSSVHFDFNTLNQFGR